jgi:hypothetical protein
MTPRSLRPLLLTLLALPLAVQGEEATNAAAATTAAAAAATKRDPFWPVGYDPAAAVAAAAAPAESAPAVSAPAEAPERKAILQIDNLTEAQLAIVRSQLKVSGIMRFGPDYVARINNQLVGAGDDLAVRVEGQELTYSVRAITKDAVQLEPKR